MMKYSNAELILGRSWERAVRVSYINEDDDSYIIHIKSQDGRREVQFCAIRGQHERNREYARSLGEVSDAHHLKG